jgi:hypothetical protein
MKLSRVVVAAIVLWFAYKGFRAIRAIETSPALRPRDPFAPVN